MPILLRTQHIGIAAHRKLCRTIRTESKDADKTCSGRYIDDMPAAARQHVGQDKLCQVHHAKVIGFVYLLENLNGDFFYVLGIRNPSIINDDIRNIRFLPGKPRNLLCTR